MGTPLQQSWSMALLAIQHDRLRLITNVGRRTLKGYFRGRDLVARSVHWTLWRQRDFVLQAVSLCPSALQFATDFQADRGVVLAAMLGQGKAGCSQALSYTSEHLKSDPEFLRRALAVRRKRVLKSLCRGAKAQLGVSA